jgi:hypothetical protein
MSIDNLSRNQIRNDLQSGDWAEDHGLFHDLLPYGYRDTNPIESLKAFQSTFKAVGEYKQLLQASHFRKHAGLDLRRGKALDQVHWAGSWPVYTHRSSNPYSYANPLYVHNTYPPVEESRRERMLQEIYEIPYWKDSKLATAWGIQVPGAQAYRRRRGYHYEKRGAHNLKKWGRTLKTLNQWRYTYSELAEVFPYHSDVLSTHVSRHAGDFNPPTNPYVHD